jgi:hypothetical protein
MHCPQKRNMVNTFDWEKALIREHGCAGVRSFLDSFRSHRWMQRILKLRWGASLGRRRLRTGRPHSIAPIFGPSLRLVGYPTPRFGDRPKLTDLVYRAVSPLRLDIPMRHVGCLNLSRLEHRPKCLWQDGRHANSPPSRSQGRMHFALRILSASIKLRQYPPIP